MSVSKDISAKWKEKEMSNDPDVRQSRSQTKTNNK